MAGKRQILMYAMFLIDMLAAFSGVSIRGSKGLILKFSHYENQIHPLKVSFPQWLTLLFLSVIILTLRKLLFILLD